MFSKNMLAAVAGLALSAHASQPYGLPRVIQNDRSQFTPRRQRRGLKRIRAKITKASRKRNRVRKPAPVYYANQQDDPAYQRFVSDMAKHCRCDYDRPCDGLLAGGLCERKKEIEDRYEGVAWSDE